MFISYFTLFIRKNAYYVSHAVVGACNVRKVYMISDIRDNHLVEYTMQKVFYKSTFKVKMISAPHKKSRTVFLYISLEVVNELIYKE